MAIEIAPDQMNHSLLEVSFLSPNTINRFIFIYRERDRIRFTTKEKPLYEKTPVLLPGFLN